MKARLTALLTVLLPIIGLASGRSATRASGERPTRVPDLAIAVKSADGKKHTPLKNHGQKATVLLFLMHDCPVANAMAPEMGRIANEYGDKGIAFFRVYATESADEVNTHAREAGLPIPGLLDPSLRLADAVGATRAPEAAVISPTGALLYCGRIDDRAVKAGVIRPVAKQQDLRRALDAILAGKVPDPQFTQAVGCYLPTKQRDNR